MKQTIILLYGGRSAEREVSVLSAESIMRAVNYDYFCVKTFFISQSGDFIKTQEFSQTPNQDERLMTNVTIDLEKKIAKIQDGTLKDLSYKLISNNNGIYKFVITYKKHITQDTNGKPIDVKYEQERHYEFSYKEENGERTYLKHKSYGFTKQDASTIYEISYY